jgi:hypothetical protein
MSQEKSLETLIDLGYKVDHSFLDFEEEMVYLLSKKTGSSKLLATITSDGLVNGASIEEYLAD